MKPLDALMSGRSKCSCSVPLANNSSDLDVAGRWWATAADLDEGFGWGSGAAERSLLPSSRVETRTCPRNRLAVEEGRLWASMSCNVPS